MRRRRTWGCLLLLFFKPEEQLGLSIPPGRTGLNQEPLPASPQSPGLVLSPLGCNFSS